MSALASLALSAEEAAESRYRYFISDAVRARYQAVKHHERDTPQPMVQRVHEALGRWAGAHNRADVPMAEAMRIACALMSQDNRPLNPRALSHRTIARRPLQYMERIGVAALEPGCVRLKGLTFRNGSGHIITEADLPGRAKTARWLANQRKAKQRQKDRYGAFCEGPSTESSVRGTLSQRIATTMGDAVKPPIPADSRGSLDPVTRYSPRGLSKKSARDTSSFRHVGGTSGVAPAIRTRRQVAATPAKVLAKQTFGLEDAVRPTVPKPLPPCPPVPEQKAQQVVSTRPTLPAPTPELPASPEPSAPAAVQDALGHVCDPNTRAPSTVVPAGLSLEARLAWLSDNAQALDAQGGFIEADEDPDGTVPVAPSILALGELAHAPAEEQEPAPEVATPRHGERPTVPVLTGKRATPAELAWLKRQFPELAGLKDGPVLAMGAGLNQLQAAALNARAHRGPARNPCGLFFNALRNIRAQRWGVRVERLA